jgi:hypothetical protein
VLSIGLDVGTPSLLISIWKISDKPALPGDVSWSARVPDTLEPSELQQTIQNPSSDESLEMITTFAPVESPRDTITAQGSFSSSAE